MYTIFLYIYPNDEISNIILKKINEKQLPYIILDYSHTNDNNPHYPYLAIMYPNKTVGYVTLEEALEALDTLNMGEEENNGITNS